MLPDRRLVSGALARAGVRIAPAAVPRAHYRAVRALDRDQGARSYIDAFCAALGVSLASAITALSELDEPGRSGKVLWSEPTPGGIEAVRALRRAGFAVLVVTNSDGYAAENLRDAGVLARTGLAEADVIDSVVVGSAKPDTAIFDAALERAGVERTEVVHVGDMLSTDVAGALAAGITPIHLDPYRSCRSPEHRHIRSLRGIWAHAGGRPKD